MGRAYDRRAMDGFTPRTTGRPNRGGFDPAPRTTKAWLKSRVAGTAPRRKTPEHEGGSG